MDFLTIDFKRSVRERQGNGGAAASSSSPLPPEDTHWAQSAGVYRGLSPSTHLAGVWRTQRNPHAQSSSSEEKPGAVDLQPTQTGAGAGRRGQSTGTVY